MGIQRETCTDAETVTIRACLDKVLASSLFAQSERQQRFLKFIVEETLAGHTDRLKGYTIGVEVFDRDPSFDPTVDAIVRVEAARLRAKLREYYEGEGRADPVRFNLQKGSYAICIESPAKAATEFPPLKASVDATPAGSAAAHPKLIDDRASLAVLPFTNMSSDPEQEYFADGITYGLITELSRLSDLFVIARHSSFVYKGLAKRVDEIGRELGVRYLLEGGVQRSGDRVRITAQLVDAASGAHLWAERYDREFKDIFAVQDDVTLRIVAVLQVKLLGIEHKRIGQGGTSSPEAHDCLLRGLERFWHYTPTSTEAARVLFARALDLDPRYAFAHAWLARALTLQWCLLWDPAPATMERAYEHARQAVDLDEHLPFAYWALCWTQLWRKQSEASITAGRRAIALDPNNADAYHILSLSLSAAGRGEEALHCIEKAMRLNPHPSPFFQMALGMSYYVLEDYDRAIAAFRYGVELKDAFVPNHNFLCLIYTLLGRNDEAHIECDKLMELTGGRTPVTQGIFIDEEIRERWRDLEELAGLRKRPL